LCDGNYAKNISVIADYVARLLVDAGCNCDQVYVTGNPAFDGLFLEESKEAGYRLRKILNLKEDERLITWIGTPSEVSIRGKPFVSNNSVINKLELYCKMHPETKFAYRPHPNRPFDMPEDIKHGFLLDGQHSIEAVLWASDVVLLETSTVGLQAALIGKPVITIAAENYPPYAELGLATDVPDLNSIESVLGEPVKPNLDKLGPQGLGDACQHVLDLVNDLLMQNVHYEKI
jgi:CDP-glycerol glycerophosphotransferase (TagB/SpsB family)